MATKTSISNDRTFAFQIMDSDSTVILAKGASISSVLANDEPYGIFESSGFDLENDHVIVDGRIYASANDGAKLIPMGVYLQSSGSSVSVGASGSIMAETCISVDADGGTITNAGTVTGLSGFGIGIASGGEGTRISNSGTITAFDGIDVSGNDIRIVNEKEGVITGYSYPVRDHAADHLSLVNHGLIESLGTGGRAFDNVLATDGHIRIVNDGRIVGDIVLEAGANVVDTRGGTIKGQILGGVGNDTLITGNAKYKLVEGTNGGTDIVKSTVGYTLSDNVENLVLLGSKNAKGTGNDLSNTITGNAGDNILVGADGNDILHGGHGDDTLTGGASSDTFVFRTGDGHDVIADFETIDEHIDVSGWKAVGSYDELRGHMKNEDGGVMIAFGHDSLFVDNLSKGDLQERHFII